MKTKQVSSTVAAEYKKRNFDNLRGALKAQKTTPRKYRGKYPNRVKQVEGLRTTGCVLVTTNNGDKWIINARDTKGALIDLNDDVTRFERTLWSDPKGNPLFDLEAARAEIVKTFKLRLIPFANGTLHIQCALETELKKTGLIPQRRFAIVDLLTKLKLMLIWSRDDLGYVVCDKETVDRKRDEIWYGDES